MTEKEFEKEIAELLSKYKETLHRETNAAVKVNELTFEIEKLQKHLSKEENNSSDLSEETDENLIEFDKEFEKLKLKLNETESRVELDVRVSGEKVTESYVKALVTIDQQVSELRNNLIEAKAKIKIRKAEIQRLRSENWEKRRQRHSEIESDDLNELKDKLRQAKDEQMFANDEGSILKMRFESFRLLADILETEE
jgi:chromosome segregation ATPase